MKKRFLSLLTVLVLMLVLAAPCFADTPGSRLVDEAQLLNSGEASTVIAALDNASAKYNADFVILTVNSLNNKSPVEYADSYYKSAGYNENGVMLLVSMGDRVWWISTFGSCADVILFGDVEDIAKNFKPYLSSGEYQKAFTAYLDSCTALLDIGAGSENAVEKSFEEYGIEAPAIYEGDAHKTVSPWWIPAALVIGLVIGLIAVSVMKNGMKTVQSNDSAANYLKDGSMKLTENRDVFLYSTVSRTPRPRDDNRGSGGGSMRMGSSGHSHGGGGHF